VSEFGNIDLRWPVAQSNWTYDDGFISVRVDDIVDEAGGTHRRSVVEHAGGVGVLAVDEDDRILLVRQYRHALGLKFVEIPAGMLDIEGESRVEAARRELAEETDLRAESWTELVQLVSSPGFCTEAVTVFLATGLSVVPESKRTEREAEEASLEKHWIDLDRAVAGVFSGNITDSKTVSAILALAAQRRK
jgi:8-oxo-dGDP phosphatase